MATDSAEETALLNCVNIKDDVSKGHDEDGNKLTTCLVVNTGGTFVMEPSDGGLVNTGYKLGDKLRRLKVFCDKDYTFHINEHRKGWLSTNLINGNKRLVYYVIQYDKLIDSSSMILDNYKQIASTIEKYYHMFDSFLIIHGTDTVEYTASILSFMFANLGKSVILTASQLPLSDEKNDAFYNLMGCFRILAHYNIPEVCFYFRDRLFRGNRIRKISTENLNAFASPSLKPLILDEVEMEVNWSIIRSLPRGKIGSKFRVDFDIKNSHSRPIKMNEIHRKGKVLLQELEHVDVSVFCYLNCSVFLGSMDS